MTQPDGEKEQRDDGQSNGEADNELTQTKCMTFSKKDTSRGNARSRRREKDYPRAASEMSS